MSVWNIDVYGLEHIFDSFISYQERKILSFFILSKNSVKRLKFTLQYVRYTCQSINNVWFNSKNLQRW